MENSENRVFQINAKNEKESCDLIKANPQQFPSKPEINLITADKLPSCR